MPFPNYSIIHEEINSQHKTQWLDGDGFTDGAGWDVDACIKNDGFTANPYICKIDPQGNKVDEIVLDVRQLGANAKADSVSIYPSGANLIIKISYHMGDFNDKRIRAVIPNYVHPYPQGVQPIGAPGAFVPGDTGGEPVGLSPEDKTWIQQQLTAAINEFDQRLGSQAPREDLKGLLRGVLQEMGVLTLALTRSGGDAGYYQQQINTAYTGAKSAIHDSLGFGGGHSAPEIGKPSQAVEEGAPTEG